MGNSIKEQIVLPVWFNNTPMGFKGPCDTLLFQAWVEKFLIKELKPGQGVIMDNASFHK
ncbi:hypothetical protein K737_300790 [Holospora undulata HU1]|uniref:Tc1-like transposase DDE domain-containing protein n=1 Tax=Holospora undulata HU1 TaxID=1321371 RepID=A0A061JHF6_9PROT|nr:hypothetical protein K737_300790 [Holospora undulata HU1]